jgi:hypothetical protein
MEYDFVSKSLLKLDLKQYWKCESVDALSY